MHIAAHADYMAEHVSEKLGPLLDAGLDLRLHMTGEEQLFEMVIEGQADLALTTTVSQDDRLVAEPVGSERLVAVAAPEPAQRIGAANTVAIGLDLEPHLAYDLMRPLVRRWLSENNLPPPSRVPAVTAPDLRVLRSLLCNGSGWSVFPEFLCKKQLESGELEEIPPPSSCPALDFYLVWAKSTLRHPRVAYAKQELLKLLKGEAQA